jgi:hypothetical protein
MKPVSMMTLTYHACMQDGSLAKRHLHRFLTHMKRHAGLSNYLWVMEFQHRGAIHFHLWTDNDMDNDEFPAYVAIVWAHITGQSADFDALCHATNTMAIEQPHALVYYATKEVASAKKLYQKMLPAGLEGAGRWWGKSQTLRVDGVAISIPPGLVSQFQAFIRSKYGTFPGYGRVIFLFDKDLTDFKRKLQQWSINCEIRSEDGPAVHLGRNRVGCVHARG